MVTRKRNSSVRSSSSGSTTPSIPTSPRGSSVIPTLNFPQFKSWEEFQEWFNKQLSGTKFGDSPNFSDPNSLGLWSDGDAYSHVLGSLGVLGGANNDFLQQILMLAGGNIGKNGSAYGDIQKLLLEMALKNLTSQEQRNYDKSVLDEQRLYDNPQNQLARLMGSGISRDAAIQMLQGGQDPALVGSGADSALPSELPSPSERLMQQLQTASGFISAISGLVSLGFSIPQALMQARLMSNQAFLSDAQKKSYVAANKAYHILHAAGSGADAFGSIASVTGEMKKLADGGNSDASAFIASSSYKDLVDNAPYSSGYIGQIYKMERSSSDYAQEYDATIANLQADTDLKQANKMNLTAQIGVFAEQINQLIATEEYYYAQANLADWSSLLTGQQIEVSKAEVTRINAETESLRLSNNLERSFQTTTLNGKSGLEIFTDYRLNELYGIAQRFSKANTEELWNKEVNSLVANYDNLIATYTLSTMYKNGTISTLNANKEQINDLLYFCNAAEENGLFDYVRTLADVETSANSSVGGSSFTRPALRALQSLDENVNDRRPRSSWIKKWFGNYHK